MRGYGSLMYAISPPSLTCKNYYPRFRADYFRHNVLRRVKLKKLKELGTIGDTFSHMLHTDDFQDLVMFT